MAEIITSAQIDAWAGDDSGLSQELIDAMSLPDTDEGIIVLLRLSSPGMPDPILVSSNAKEFFGFDDETKEPMHGVTFKDEQYHFCPFSIELFSDLESGDLSTATVSIHNISPDLTIAIREVDIAIDFSIIVLRKNDTSRAEMVMDFAKLTEVSVNARTIRGTLSDYDYGSEPITPNYTRSEYRGL